MAWDSIMARPKYWIYNSMLFVSRGLYCWWCYDHVLQLPMWLLEPYDRGQRRGWILGDECCSHWNWALWYGHVSTFNYTIDDRTIVLCWVWALCTVCHYSIVLPLSPSVLIGQNVVLPGVSVRWLVNILFPLACCYCDWSMYCLLLDVVHGQSERSYRTVLSHPFS